MQGEQGRSLCFTSSTNTCPHLYLNMLVSSGSFLGKAALPLCCFLLVCPRNGLWVPLGANNCGFVGFCVVEIYSVCK